MSVGISKGLHGLRLLFFEFASFDRAYLLVHTPRPTPFLAAEHYLLRDPSMTNRSSTHLGSNPLISSAIDIKESINQRLRTKLHPSIVAINHEHQVVIARLVEAVQVLSCAVDFRQMRAAFNKSWVVECLVPVDDGRSWVSKDVARYDCLAEIGIWS
jgi:hypothetical protein